MDSSTSSAEARAAPLLDVVVATIFPEVIEHYCAASVLGRAQDSAILRVRALDLRTFTTDRHRSVDDSPFGGGPGMVMMAPPVLALARSGVPRPLIAMSPSGRPFSQRVARELADLGGFTLLCGRYEGIDERALDLEVDDQISIGDFVLAGGELGALVVIEAVARLIPGVLGNAESHVDESFGEAQPHRVEYPHYTRPAVVEGHAVPEVLLSGDHAKVQRWRRAKAVVRTLQRRPDLIAAEPVSPEERALLREFGLEDLLGAEGTLRSVERGSPSPPK